MSLEIEHAWAESQMPWYVNGRLPLGEHARFEAHLQACEACRADLAAERRLSQQMSAAPVVEYAPQASFARLAARLDSPTVSARRDSRRRLRGPTAVIVAQAATIAVLAVTLAWTAWTRPEAAAPYRTLSRASAGQGHAPQLQVRFADQASAADIVALLGRIDGRIVAGPSAARVFQVALPGDGDPDAVASALARLQADPAVSYVQVMSP